METKFQSSFIPKGPILSDKGSSSGVKKPRSILGLLAGFLFGLSILAAVASLAYKFYLDYALENMAVELEAKRAEIEEETVAEILRLNNRLLAAENLINSHTALSPFFDFLEAATLQNVRFTEFSFEVIERTPKVTMRGEAASYGALALQADVLNESANFNNPVFSDVSLDESGNVTFSFMADIDPALISYRREVERSVVPVSPVVEEVTTVTATSSSASATTTANSASQN